MWRDKVKGEGEQHVQQSQRGHVRSPACTVKASMNWSFQEEAPITREALPRCIMRSTEL